MTQLDRRPRFDIASGGAPQSRAFLAACISALVRPAQNIGAVLDCPSLSALKKWRSKRHS